MKSYKYNIEISSTLSVLKSIILREQYPNHTNHTKCWLSSHEFYIGIQNSILMAFVTLVSYMTSIVLYGLLIEECQVTPIKIKFWKKSQEKKKESES